MPLKRVETIAARSTRGSAATMRGSMRGRPAVIKVPPRTMKLAEKNYDRERKLAEAVVADRAFALSQVAHGCLQSTIFEAEGFDISVLAPASAPKGAQRHQATPADIERPAAIGRPLRPAVALEGATVYPSQTNDIQCSLLTPLPPILPPIHCSSRQGSSTMASAPALLTPKPAHAPAPAPASKQEAHWAQQDPQEERGVEAAAAHRPSYGFISHQEWSPPQPFVSYAATGAIVAPALLQHGVQLTREPRDRNRLVTAAAARLEAQRIVALHEAREAIARERAEVRAVMPRVESRGVLVPRLPLSTLHERLFEVEAAEAAHVEATAIAAEQARQVAARARAVEATRQASRQASRQAQLKAGEAQEAERARAVQLAQEATVKATDAALLGLLAYKATEAKAEAERAARDTQVEAAKDRAEARAAHQHAHLKAAHDLESRFVPRRSVERKVRGEVSGVESEVSEEAIRVTAEEGERMGRMVVAQQMLAEYRAGACFADRRLLHDFD